MKLVMLRLDILFHNIWHSVDGSNNYVGNFNVTYQNGVVVNNAAPLVRAINSNSPFTTDFLGGTLQPTDLNAAFDDSNLLATSGSAFSPGNGAALGTYLYDPSNSLFSEQQGSGIVSFDESVNGAVRSVSFTWVGRTIGSNTAFIGFAGTAIAGVPEPNSLVFLVVAATPWVLTRRRQQIS